MATTEEEARNDTDNEHGNEDDTDKVINPMEQPSIIEMLRQEAEEVGTVQWVDIPIPGFEKTGLRARYRLPKSGKEIDTIVRKVTRDFKDNYERNIFIAIDTMITLCEGFYVTDPNGGEEPIPLDDTETGEVAKYDAYLVEMLGYENVSGARATVRKVFGMNDLAIGAHMEKLQRWLQDTSVDINDDFWQTVGGR